MLLFTFLLMSAAERKVPWEAGEVASAAVTAIMLVQCGVLDQPFGSIETTIIPDQGASQICALLHTPFIADA